MEWFSFILAFLLAVVHFFAYKLKFLNKKPRSVWLSIAGGTSVAYIFIHLLPEIAAGQEAVKTAAFDFAEWFRHHLYLVALFGICTFYGLERYVKQNREEGSDRVFWFHIVFFSFYNILIGCILSERPEAGLGNLIFFFVAMAFHFLVNDYALKGHHQEIYASRGRWVLSLAVLLGWAVGAVFDISEVSLFVIISFLAGGIILNVLKEELPEESESSYWAFICGAVVYTFLLIYSF